MPLPETFIQHLRDFGYHPRSDKHSNALAVAIVEDLLATCEPLAALAKQGRLVYTVNLNLTVGTSTWNTDLAIGTVTVPVNPGELKIARATPTTTRIAVEIKGVMTEHRKAVKNRKRDLEAHHEHVHNYDRHAIAGGVMVINASPIFQSPLRTGLTSHGTPAAITRLVEHCMTEIRNVTQSGGVSAYGLDAKTAIIVSFDNVSPGEARYFTQPPAPQPGDPLHYDSFIQKLCDEYCNRFPTGA
jgi:hypothetical protein